MKKTNIFSAFAAFLTAGFFASPAFAVLGQPEPGGLGLQAAASPMKERMHDFHNYLLLPLTVVISIFVLILLVIVVVKFNRKANPTPSTTTHNTLLEVVWTV